MNLTIITLAAEILGMDPAALTQAAASESFLGLGGDSLRALALVARVRDELGLRIRLGELLGERPFAETAETAEAAEPIIEEQAGPGQEPRRNHEQAPHSASGLLAADDLLGGSAYNLVFAARMSGPLRVTLLEQAMRHVVRRHEQLRTVYPEPGHAEVLDLHVPVLEQIAGPAPATDFEAFVRAVAEAEAHRRMLPSRRPPLRFLLVSRDDQHTLIIIVHHAMVDGWAVGLLVRELFDAYDSLCEHSGLSLTPGPAPQLLNEELDRLALSGELGRQATYWTNALREVPSVLELPSDLSRPAVQDPRGARLPFALSPEATEAVCSCARRLRITPCAVFLASYALVIARYTGQRRFVIGVPVARRSSRQAAEVIGYATNIVPVVAEVDDAGTAGAHLIRTGMALAAALQHADIPLSQLIRALDIPADPRRNPLIHFVLGMHDQLLPSSLDAGKLKVQLEEGYGGGAPFDVTLFVQRADPAYRGVLEFATSVVTSGEAAALLSSFVDAVSSLVSRPDQPLSDTRCITRQQQERLTRLNRHGTADGTTGYAPPAPTSRHSAGPAGSAGTVPALVLQRARQTPEALAVHDAGTGHRVTYRELARSAAVQADRLRSTGVTPGARVLVALPRSVAEIVGLLGTLHCGAAYVAVDPGWPASRLRQIIAITQPAALLAASDVAATLADLGGGMTADTWEPSWAGDSPAPDPVPAGGPDQTAYVAFTSGSTGVPKGVCVPHRAVMRLVRDADYVRCGPGERFLRFAPLAFDASTLEIWAPLANGGTIEIYSGGFPSPAEFGEFLANRGITALWLTSGLFRLVADLCPEAFRGVRQVLTGGDVVPPQPVRHLLELYPGLRITNGYGPTENTTFTTIHHLDHPQDADDPLPIGRPIRGTEVFVLDDQARLVPPGATGELYAAGEGLASGYLGNPAETERSFGEFSPDVPRRLYRTGDVVRMDGNGNLKFLGRRDHQVKIRGFRIELEEVRQAVLDHPAVAEAVVTAVGDTSAERRLLAAVMPARGAIDDIRSHVAARLPAFMRPALWLEVDNLPVTPNGKVDIASLAAMALGNGGGPPSPARPGGSARESSPARPEGSRTDLARDVREGSATDLARDVMAEVLKRTSFGDEDNFFDLGGDSLGISRLLGLLRKRHHINIRLRDFYAEPTAKLLSRLIELSEAAEGQASAHQRR